MLRHLRKKKAPPVWAVPAASVFAVGVLLGIGAVVWANARRRAHEEASDFPLEPGPL